MSKVLQIALWLGRGFLAAVFFYSGFMKLGISESFAVTILYFNIVPERMATGIAMTLPWVEVCLAILLVVPRVYRWSAICIGCLCVLFICAVTWALSQGIVVDCGCFGESVPSFGKMKLAIARDIFLIAVAAFVAFVPSRRRTEGASAVTL